MTLFLRSLHLHFWVAPIRDGNCDKYFSWGVLEIGLDVLESPQRDKMDFSRNKFNGEIRSTFHCDGQCDYASW